MRAHRAGSFLGLHTVKKSTDEVFERTVRSFSVYILIYSGGSLCAGDSSSAACAREKMEGGGGRAGSQRSDVLHHLMELVQVHVFPTTVGCKHCQL